MNLPVPDQFGEFFQAVHGYDSFPWQSRLAKRVCAGDWPRAIALPTASGKTACIDIAVFALACGVVNAPKRIFFVVDRRIVVDQAFEHAKGLAQLLGDAKDGVLKQVADSLRRIADDERPLDVYELRGGMYRETAWTRSPLQPTVIASTVDQVGSRLLFRGYGVSDSMKPVHAGLVGNDALILLDEAHCSKPFDQTMQSVQNYRSWNPSVAPFVFVSITATPAGNVPTERAQEDDLAHPVLGKRINASKPAKLVVAEKAKGKNGTTELVKVLEKEARDLAKEAACVGIIVNRVKTARELAAKLGNDAVLLIGRMRPLDRDRLYNERLKPLLSHPTSEQAPPRFVVGTQCLECGADFDFHALVTECASLDALRQRFGRLNRVGKRENAKAVIVVRGDQTEPKEKDSEQDPVYENSLAHAWKWLSNNMDGAPEGDTPWIDMGVAAVAKKWEATSEQERVEVTAPAADAPVLFPAHLDCWVQTNPVPTPDPDPALFLHGPKKPGQPDVQVVFRDDLGDDTKLWAEIVSLCPPSSSEAVSVPIGVFKKWLAAEDFDDQSSDVEGERTPDDDAEEVSRSALLWRGPEKSVLVTDSSKLYPNAVFVVPCSSSGTDLLGHFPNGLTDDAEEAFQLSRDKVLLRLRDLKVGEQDDVTAIITAAIQAIYDQLPAETNEKLRVAINKLTNPKQRLDEPHPLGGFVVVGKKRVERFEPTALDDSEADTSFRGRAVSLEEHSRGVADHAKRFATGCQLDADLYYQAGLWHDLGKLDPRFQAMLKQSSPRTAVGEPLAKSARIPRNKRERDEAREVHCYPSGARHELLSAALVSTRTDDDLLLHLIATHHGSGRPFADPVEENEAARAPFTTKPLFGETFGLPTSRQQIADWNGVLPERFWRVVRQQGWWGAAYHETVFRLADHAQSRLEQETEPATDAPAVAPSPFVPCRDKPPRYTLALTGLDGSNPLAFLAALGTLLVCDRLSHQENAPAWLKGKLKLSWGTNEGAHIPVLHLADTPPSSTEFTKVILEALAREPSSHPSGWAVALLETDPLQMVQQLQQKRASLTEQERAGVAWVTSLLCESVPGAASQLQTVRRDYLLDNVRAVMQGTNEQHLLRSLFQAWDYADGLANQSLHWEPTEDRRHAYQWHMPSGDPTRKKKGGMLGANRLAFEAWPLFPSFPDGDRVTTRGFQGNRAASTYWNWPLWSFPATPAVIESLLALSALHEAEFPTWKLRQLGVSVRFQLQRILVGKTPNFTTAVALA